MSELNRPCVLPRPSHAIPQKKKPEDNLGLFFTISGSVVRTVHLFNAESLVYRFTPNSERQNGVVSRLASLPLPFASTVLIDGARLPPQRSGQSSRRSFYLCVVTVGESEGEAVAVRTFDAEARERDEPLPVERAR